MQLKRNPAVLFSLRQATASGSQERTICRPLSLLLLTNTATGGIYTRIEFKSSDPFTTISDNYNFRLKGLGPGSFSTCKNVKGCKKPLISSNAVSRTTGARLHFITSMTTFPLCVPE